MKAPGTARADALGSPASTPSDVLLALADRCEREEPSLEVSYLVFKATHPENRGFGLIGILEGEDAKDWKGLCRYFSVPDYPARLDACARLLPPNWFVAKIEFDGEAWLVIVTLGVAGTERTWGCAPTEAAARIAAALRARAQTGAAIDLAILESRGWSREYFIKNSDEFGMIDPQGRKMTIEEAVGILKAEGSQTRPALAHGEAK